MSNNLQEITLIIPTYNRPQYFSRLLNYYATKKTQINFLVLDSSEDIRARVLNEQAIKVLGSHVRYMFFPSTIPFAVKLFEGLRLVSTPFCAFCADDDLVFVNGLAQALAALKKNADYVCVDGIYMNFTEVGHDIHLKVEYDSSGIAAEHPCARVFRLYQRYESLFYGVFRTQHALAIFTNVIKNESLHYQELFQATAALLLGKSHRLPIFYAARQHCQPADTRRDKWQTYYWFAKNPKEFLQHYIIYRDELWTFYQQHVVVPNYQEEEFFQSMDIAHAMYFGIGCPPDYFYSVLQDQWPNDSFQNPHSFEGSICNQLKPSQRFWLTFSLVRFVERILKKIAFFNSRRDLKSLNKQIQKTSKFAWNCRLSPELRWLTSIDSFRNSYFELCQYMES